jgi:flagellar protein FlgJ
MKVDGLVDSALLNAPSTAPRVAGRSDEELRKASKEFESMFMNLVMKEMRETVPDGGAWGDTSKVKFFQGMLDEEYAKLSTNKSQNSLSELIFKNLKAQVKAGKL